MRGLFITVDGPGGVGKSTLLPLLGAELGADGHDVHLTREPTDGLLGTIARHHTATYSNAALACLVAADRYHHLATEIVPALKRGQVIICDRYVPSSYVLQSRDGVLLDYIRHLNSIAPRPDAALLLTAAPALLEQRLRERGAHSRFEYDGSSATEVLLYDELVPVLVGDGFPVFRVDTGELSPQCAVEAVRGHIGGLLSRR